MLEFLKKILKIGKIMRYTALKCWAKLDGIHQFTSTEDFLKKLTNVIFVYFRYPIKIIQCLTTSLKWITKCKAA